MQDDPTITGPVNEIIARHRDREGPLLPILHDVEENFGHIPQEALPPIAEALRMSRAEVQGVVSFYHDFHREPVGRHVVKLCRSEACQALGAEALADHVRGRLGIGWNDTTPDGQVTLEPVYCLGLCACGPSMLVDGRVEGRVDAARFDELVAEVR
ncbi:formate dehydrogenase subunit gamma [Pontibaca methylaminivorans]|uniref:formate dehydrogenase subunit gamma n=1 Tax=Pontibaca methylaminivorans TaxID=515897 RepID=UPI002FD9F4EB